MIRHALFVPLALLLALSLAACAPERRSNTDGGGREGEGEGEGGNEGEGEGEGGNEGEGEGEGPHLVDAGTPAEGEGEGGEGEGEGPDMAAYCAESAPDTGGGGNEEHHPNPCDAADGCADGLGCKLDQETPGEYTCSPQWGPRGEDEMCQTPGECQAGLTCVSGRCVRFCFDDSHCPGERGCTGGDLNFTIDGEQVFASKLCGQGAGHCNPLCSESHCGRGLGCYVGRDEAGAPTLGCEQTHAEAPDGAGSCGGEEGKYFPSKCAPGWVCDGMAPDPQCQQVCNMEWGELDNPSCAEGQACGGAVHRDFSELGYCID